MSKKSLLRQGVILVFIVVCSSFVIPIQVNALPEERCSSPLVAGHDYFEQATVAVFGSCNGAYVLGFSWRCGLFIPLVRRTVYLDADEENVSLTVVVLKSNQGFGIYHDYDNMHVTLRRARGVFFWGGKSLLTTSDVIVGFCNALSVSVSY
jgi:hypothetical protein